MIFYSINRNKDISVRSDKKSVFAEMVIPYSIFFSVLNKLDYRM